MDTARMEAFSDGVFAILITIMVLNLEVPRGESFSVLRPTLPAALTYLLSFVYLAVYWTNHHHLLQVTERVTGSLLWANLHLLFWLSLIPFTTAWMGQNHFASAPSALYGAILFMAAFAYWLLQQRIIASQGANSLLKRALAGDWKGKLSPFLYLLAIAASFWFHWIAQGIYVLVAMLWLVPDKRIERVLPP